MDCHGREFAGCRPLMIAFTTAAVIVAGLMVPMEARTPWLNGPVTVTRVAVRLKVGGSVKPPKKLVDVKPDYPDEARAARIEGVVIVGIVIGEDGSVIDATVLRSIPTLDQAALEAVSQWEFEPTLLNGEAVELEMNVTVNFALE